MAEQNNNQRPPFKRKFRINNITLLGLLTYFSENVQVKLLGIVVFLPMLIVAFTVYYGYITILAERTESDKTIAFLTENRTALIVDHITENYKRAKLQTKYVKESIVRDLNTEYNGNTARMKRDYDSRDYKNKFYTILSENISYRFINKQTNKNRVFVANKDGVLIDNSAIYSKNSYKKWDDLIDASKDQAITKEAIENIKTAEKDEPLLWLDSKVDDNVHPISEIQGFTPNTSPIGFIESCALSGNMSALDQYSIIAVSYIYDSNDIFGVPDVSAGHYNENDKIYIIQATSIKDILDSSPELTKSLIKIDRMIQEKQEATDNSAYLKTICIILLAVMETMTFFGIWYLAEFYIYSKFSRRSKERNEKFNHPVHT